MLVFKACALLSYPSEDMRRALPEIAEIVRTAPLLDPLAATISWR
jgi:hypothetical protein